MTGWLTTIQSDLGQLPKFIAYYENELDDAKREVRISGNLEKNVRDLPGITEHRFGQLQEIEAVLNFLNIELRKIRRKWFKKYLENYQKMLSSRDAEKYVDGEQEVVDYDLLINEVALLRNKWLAVMKGLDVKQFQVSNITKLRCAGMEDVSL